MKRMLLSSCILFLMGFSSISFGQQTQQASPSAFMQQAELYGLSGSSVGYFAIEKLKNKQLKRYAMLAHNDYAQVNRKLMVLATKKKIELMNMVSDSAATSEFVYVDTKENLADDGPLKLKHPFDVSYLKMMIEDFQTAIAYYEGNLNSDDSDIKLYIEECLPILKKNMIEAISFTQQTLAKE